VFYWVDGQLRPTPFQARYVETAASRSPKWSQAAQPVAAEGGPVSLGATSIGGA